MKIFFTFILFSLINTTCLSQENNTQDKARFIIQINDKEYSISEGEELKMDGVLDQPTISVKLAAYKIFDAGNLSFNYPNHFSYEMEKDIGYKSWTLDGNNFVIMLFEIGAELELDDFIKEMVAQFGKNNCRVSKRKMVLGGQELIGQRINVTLVGQKLTYDLLEIKSDDFKTKFIAFQDSLNKDENATEESKVAIQMINNSIQYK